MLTTNLLRTLHFFDGLDEGQLQSVAAVTEVIWCGSGTVLFEEGLPINALYLLIEGGVDLYYSTSGDPRDQRLICEIDIGEPFGISALIEPHALTATAETSRPSRILKMDADGLRGQFEKDPRLGYRFMSQLAHTAMMRLHFARMHLAMHPA